MMTERPGMWLEPCVEAGADIFSMHAETINRDVFRLLNQIDEAGVVGGVVLNPATRFEDVEYYVERLSLVTFMTVDVGFAGQPFIEQALRKVEKAVTFREQQGLDYTVQIDGSCNARTFKRLRDAGAEMLILGSSGLFGLDQDIDAAWDTMVAQYEDATGERVA